MGQRGDRHGHRLVDMSTVEPVDFLAQFEPEDLSEDEIVFDLGPAEARCIQKFVSHRGQIVWFSIVLVVWDAGSWRPVVRADTCHAEVHLHRFVRGRRADVSRHHIRAVTTLEDVEQGFDEACDVILEGWDENVRRWKSGGA